MQASKYKIIKKFSKMMCFVCVIVLLLSISSYLLDPVRLGYEDKVAGRDSYMVSLMAEPSDTVDVVILGDSESFTFISPMHLWKNSGIASYIGGQSGQRIMETYYGLKRILKSQSPKLLILETNTMFNCVGFMSEINCIAHEVGYYYFPVLKYHSMWKNMVEEVPDIPAHYNGFEIRSDIDPYTGGEYMHETEQTEEMSGFVDYYMDGIMRLCDEHDIEILLVTAPSPLNHTYEKHNALVEYADENDLPYIDLNMMNDELGIDWQTDTLDKGDHLNMNGVLKTSAYLEQYLNENYELEDHRGEEDYREWDERADDFMKRLNPS